MNSKNKDSATVALPFHYVPFPECPAVMDWGARSYLGKPSKAYCDATLHLVNYSVISD